MSSTDYLCRFLLFLWGRNEKGCSGFTVFCGAVSAVVMVQTWSNGPVGLDSVEGIVSFVVVLLPYILFFRRVFGFSNFQY